MHHLNQNRVKVMEEYVHTCKGMVFYADELAKATHSYGRSSVIGKGKFGTVYKGTLRHCTDAIKILSQVKPKLICFAKLRQCLYTHAVNYNRKESEPFFQAKRSHQF